jgi:hydroxymethylbilane synthase
MTALVTGTRAIRIGTRGSRLALAQSGLVARALEAATGAGTELVEITTDGDRTSAPLVEVGGQGVFVGAVREALVRGDVDVAVHSLKDLPVVPDPRVEICAVPVREDARDALVARDALTLRDLPSGSVIGTGSPRRAAQLRAVGGGWEIVAVRGNVDTRLRLVSEGRVDAVVVACAGLARLDRAHEISEILGADVMLPAPGQGALAIEVAAGSSLADPLREAVDDHATRAAVTAERAVLAGLEAGCSAPVGAWAVPDPADVGWLRLDAAVVSTDGRTALRAHARGRLDEASALGARLADELLAQGAADLVGGVPGGSP